MFVPFLYVNIYPQIKHMRANQLPEIKYARWSFSLPHPADARRDGDAHEQHRADRHASYDAGHDAVGSEHVVVQPA